MTGSNADFLERVQRHKERRSVNVQEPKPVIKTSKSKYVPADPYSTENKLGYMASKLNAKAYRESHLNYNLRRFL